MIGIKFGYYNQMLKTQALQTELSLTFLPAFPALPLALSQSNRIKGIQGGVPQPVSTTLGYGSFDKGTA